MGLIESFAECCRDGLGYDNLAMSLSAHCRTEADEDVGWDLESGLEWDGCRYDTKMAVDEMRMNDCNPLAT